MRPDQRPMRRLPTLQARRDTLEKCVFCPKLCRTTCPVSNEEPRETLTPWGKMSMAYFSAHGDVDATESFASPAWACTGCRACTNACDHKNDVTGTLLDARSALVASGLAPQGARDVLESFDAHVARTEDAGKKLGRETDARADARTHVVVGCEYVHHAPAAAIDILRASAALTGAPIALARGCCGLPLLYAGDLDRFARHADSFAAMLRDADHVLVADAGCAIALKKHYPAAGVTVKPTVELLVETAARSLAVLTTLRTDVRVRYHDPCQLGRGLGVYEAPRAVLTRILGKAPEEFADRRERATCSGAGGLLPRTMPETSKRITASRASEHRKLGGGLVVTACASSLRAFRNAGLDADDISTLIARSLA